MSAKERFSNIVQFSPSRRRFVQGIAMGGVLAGLGVSPRAVFASAASRQGPQTLHGNQFDLTIGTQSVNFTGNPRTATTINGSLPAPILRWREGETVTLRVTNNLPVDSSIHWHGLILPNAMDGVPGLTFNGIKPGETFSYQFPVVQSGTYWYHSHSGFQEQTGLYGAIVIDPREREPFTYDRDYVIQLSDWTDEDPHAVYKKLKKLSHYYNFNERTGADLWNDIQQKGVAQTWQERAMWNRMRMSDRDISDVTGYSYTFLMNGQTPAEGWMGLFQRGERVLLRFINSSAMTFFDVRIPGLKMTVVAADGQYVEPVTVDEIRMGVAETYDVIVEPKDDSAYTLFAQAIDRSGFARGTLTPDPSLTASVPELDPKPVLTHADMGMGHDMHDMTTAPAAPMDHSSHNTSVQPTMAMDHSSHGSHMPPSTAMDHSSHSSHTPPSPAMDHGSHTTPPSTAMGHSNHGSHTPPPMAMDHSSHTLSAGLMPASMNTPVAHAPTEYGPHVDMRAENPQQRLDDPGVGLRNNGRRVLTYADLRHLGPAPDPRDPTREIELHLTGNMSRYMWSFNGIKFADAEPLRLTYGERVRITLVNDTMMNHPIHLHGMWSDLETGDPQYLPRKHTVIVQPGAKISYRVSADAMGNWAYHCHLLYHMLGMFRTVVVS